MNWWRAASPYSFKKQASWSDELQQKSASSTCQCFFYKPPQSDALWIHTEHETFLSHKLFLFIFISKINSDRKSLDLFSAVTSKCFCILQRKLSQTAELYSNFISHVPVLFFLCRLSLIISLTNIFLIPDFKLLQSDRQRPNSCCWRSCGTSRSRTK